MANTNQKVPQLSITVGIGSDDIREGSRATVNLTYRRPGTTNLTIPFELNNGANWSNYTFHPLTMPIDQANPPTVGDLTSFEISYTGGGGIGGDNWNMDVILVTYTLDTGEEAVLVKGFGEPFVRFTGDNPSWTYALSQ